MIGTWWTLGQHWVLFPASPIPVCLAAYLRVQMANQSFQNRPVSGQAFYSQIFASRSSRHWFLEKVQNHCCSKDQPSIVCLNSDSPSRCRTAFAQHFAHCWVVCFHYSNKTIPDSVPDNVKCLLQKFTSILKSNPELEINSHRVRIEPGTGLQQSSVLMSIMYFISTFLWHLVQVIKASPDTYISPSVAFCPHIFGPFWPSHSSQTVHWFLRLLIQVSLRPSKKRILQKKNNLPPSAPKPWLLMCDSCVFRSPLVNL